MENLKPAHSANYEVVRGGPGCWYVMNVQTRKLLPFKTKRAALAACSERNGNRLRDAPRSAS